MTATAYAETETEYNKAAEQIPVPFERLEKALEKQGSGPIFNCAAYSLVDAAYAPFVALLLLRPGKNSVISRNSRDSMHGVKRWSRASTHSSPPAEFEAMDRGSLKRRKKWVSQFVEAPRVAAE